MTLKENHFNLASLPHVAPDSYSLAMTKASSVVFWTMQLSRKHLDIQIPQSKAKSSPPMTLDAL